MVYPEGHRNYGSDKPLTLKKGMIRYAYERGMKVQIVISIGNDSILNESTLTCSFEGVTIVSHIAEVIDPKTYKSEEEFYEDICKMFEKDYKMTQTNFNQYNNIKT